MTNEVEYVFMSLDIWMSLLMQCQVFHHFKIMLLDFLFWGCVLYTYGYTSFIIYDWQIFSHSLWLVFISFKLSFEEQIKQWVNEA